MVKILRQIYSGVKFYLELADRRHGEVTVNVWFSTMNPLTNILVRWETFPARTPLQLGPLPASRPNSPFYIEN